MSYIVGNRAEAQTLAESMNTNHPDRPYRAELYGYPPAYKGPWGDAARDALADHPEWGVFQSTDGFMWNARSVARHLAEHPIRVIP